MSGAIRVVDRARDLADFDESAFVAGRVVQWDDQVAKFVGKNPTYTHSQLVPSATWSITHNLGCKPSVTVVDSAGTVCVGAVQYISNDVLQVTFTSPFGGTAYLN